MNLKAKSLQMLVWLCLNNALWLDAASHITFSNQLECIISAKICFSHPLLKRLLFRPTHLVPIGTSASPEHWFQHFEHWSLIGHVQDELDLFLLLKLAWRTVIGRIVLAHNLGIAFDLLHGPGHQRDKMVDFGQVPGLARDLAVYDLNENHVGDLNSTQLLFPDHFLTV